MRCDVVTHSDFVLLEREILVHQLDLRDTLAGIIGSLMCVYIGQPFDTVKTRIQTRPEQYRGVLDCFKQTLRQEGLRAYWNGATAAAVSAVVENSVVSGCP